jgi:hypothetical protein
MNAFPLQGILAFEHRFERADKLRSVHRRGIAGAAQESMTFDAGIGADAQEAEVGFGGVAQAAVIVRQRDARPLEEG